MSKNIQYQCDFCVNKILDDGMGSAEDYPHKIFEITVTGGHICNECLEDDEEKGYGVDKDGLKEIKL